MLHPGLEVGKPGATRSTQPGRQPLIECSESRWLSSSRVRAAGSSDRAPCCMQPRVECACPCSIARKCVGAGCAQRLHMDASAARHCAGSTWGPGTGAAAPRRDRRTGEWRGGSWIGCRKLFLICEEEEIPADAIATHLGKLFCGTGLCTAECKWGPRRRQPGSSGQWKSSAFCSPGCAWTDTASHNASAFHSETRAPRSHEVWHLLLPASSHLLNACHFLVVSFAANAACCSLGQHAFHMHSARISHAYCLHFAWHPSGIPLACLGGARGGTRWCCSRAQKQKIAQLYTRSNGGFALLKRSCGAGAHGGRIASGLRQQMPEEKGRERAGGRYGRDWSALSTLALHASCRMHNSAQAHLILCASAPSCCPSPGVCAAAHPQAASPCRGESGHRAQGAAGGCPRGASQRSSWSEPRPRLRPSRLRSPRRRSTRAPCCAAGTCA